jgi:hypothetical protein
MMTNTEEVDEYTYTMKFNPNKKTQECDPEKWKIHKIYNKIKKGDICKPQSGRVSSDWVINSKDAQEGKTSVESFIRFLLKQGTTVEPFTINRRDKQHRISRISFILSESGEKIYAIEYLIDGNHRIYSIVEFFEKPLSVFLNERDILRKHIDDTFKDNIHTDEIRNKIMDLFVSMNYDELMTFTYSDYFSDKMGEEWYVKYMKLYRDEMDYFLGGNKKRKIHAFRKLFMTDSGKYFTEIEANVNYYNGLTPEQENELYASINRYKSVFLYTDNLSSALYTATNFTIHDDNIRNEITNSLEKVYDERDKTEHIACHKIDKSSNNGMMNGCEFIIGYQNHCYGLKKIGEFVEPITKITSKSNRCLFVKLFEALFGDVEVSTFNTYNVNSFIEYIEYTKVVLNKTYDKLRPEYLGKKLDKSSNYKISKYGLNTNNNFALFMYIFGFKKKNVPNNIVVNEIYIAIIYHYFVRCINDPVEKTKYMENKDLITVKGEHKTMMTTARDIYNNPGKITEFIDPTQMTNLMRLVIDESFDERKYEHRADGTKDKKDTRRTRKHWEILMYVNVYRKLVPYDHMQNPDYFFWNEHEVPFSSSWPKGEILDIDRLGNTIPIPEKYNRARSNKHIDEYKIIEKTYKLNYINNLSPYIPDTQTYDNIVHHNNRKPHIFNIEAYNEWCKLNEDRYIESFVKTCFDN